MEKLPTDVLREILDYLDPHTEDFTSTNWVHARRRYKPSDDRGKALCNIAQLRLVCKRFRSLGAPYLFRCAVLRFSQQSLRKLDLLSQNPQLARYVRKFVYLMPYLYVEGTRKLEDIYREHDTAQMPSSRRVIEHSKEVQAILREQEVIISGAHDLRVLKRAMKAFSSLQSVHILRSVGELETAHSQVPLSTRPETWDYVYYCWVPACKRAIETVFEALEFGKPPVESIRCPGLSPHSFEFLGLPYKLQDRVLSDICRNLTHLELHFDDRMFLLFPQDSSISASSDLFHQMFSAATRLERLYLGFSLQHPPNVSMESIFYGVVWKSLNFLAVDSWILSAEEIYSFIRRHKSTLRGVRLENIHLREPDRWVKDLVIPLRMLFSQQGALEWISLEGCGYESEFASNSNFDTEAVNLALGIEGPDSDNEETEDEYAFDGQQGLHESGHGSNGNGVGGLTGTQGSLPVAIENRYRSEVDANLHAELLAMEDTGGSVTHEQRRLWEKHVMGRS